MFIGTLICVNRYRMKHSSIYLNLQGTYVMMLDSTSIVRSFDIIPLGLNVRIEDDDIRLPLFDYVHSGFHNVKTYHDIDRIYEERNGKWKIISSNPDSIFIDARMHMLHGKYQVKSKTYKTGSLGYTTADYLYLDNDSTHLCLKKVK